jgi:hypothetical protein
MNRNTTLMLQFATPVTYATPSYNTEAPKYYTEEAAYHTSQPRSPPRFTSPRNSSITLPQATTKLRLISTTPVHQHPDYYITTYVAPTYTPKFQSIPMPRVTKLLEHQYITPQLFFFGNFLFSSSIYIEAKDN